MCALQVVRGSSDLEMPTDFQRGGDFPACEQLVAIHFDQLMIKYRAIVTTSYLTFDVNETPDTCGGPGCVEALAAPVTLEIRGVLDLDARSINTSAVADISSRPHTRHAVYWTVPVWSEMHQLKQTPDLSPIIQEVGHMVTS